MGCDDDARKKMVFSASVVAASSRIHALTLRLNRWLVLVEDGGQSTTSPHSTAFCPAAYYYVTIRTAQSIIPGTHNTRMQFVTVLSYRRNTIPVIGLGHIKLL